MTGWMPLRRDAGYGYRNLREKPTAQENQLEFKHKSVLLQETIDNLKGKTRRDFYHDGSAVEVPDVPGGMQIVDCHGEGLSV